MGCCSTEKGSEEDQIILCFNKILKENHFNFNIKNYEENYQTISKLSGNNFKKLCKKQNVRIAFIKIIKNDGKIIAYNKDNNEEIQKILYYIIILTLLPENKIEEENFISDNNNIKLGINNLSNLKIDLLLHGYYIFDHMSSEINNNKNIIYHLAKMFNLCFRDLNESNNYICIKTYINNIHLIIINNCLEDEDEYYIFIRDNILALGEFFHYNDNFIITDEEKELLSILIELYSNILFHHFKYLTNNFSLIKENINKNIRNTTSKLMALNINKKNKDNILPNIIQAFDIINSFNENIKKDYKDFKDINLVIECLYYFLKVSAQDIYSGKNLLNMLGKKLKEKNQENKDKFNDIILLLFFYECCIKDDEKLALCLLDYITDEFLNEDSNIQINENNIFYDIILDSYYLIYKNETLTKQYISLLSQIFMKEIENNCKNSLFLNQLIQIYHKKEKMINKIIKLFFYFLVNISQYYKEKINIINNNENIINNEIATNINIINNILINLNTIIKTYFIYNNGFPSLINENNNNIVCSSINNNTYNIYNNNNINNVKILISDYNLIIQNFFDFKFHEEDILNNIEFFLYFHLFIIYNMDIMELINDFSKKEKIYYSIFKMITKLEIILIQISVQENNNHSYSLYLNDLIVTIQIILKLIEINDEKLYIQDCYILYKSIERNIQSLLESQKLNENGNNEIDSSNLKIIYSIIFFILSQFIRLINIPNSINKNHKEILECINKSNEKCGSYLSIINVSNFNLYNEIIEPNLQYLKELLIQKDDSEQFFINYNSLKQILDIIYSKLFGKDTSLYIFFDNQILNSKYFYNMETNSYKKSVSKASDNITEVRDNSLINHYDNDYNENYIDDISIHIIAKKNKQKNENEIDNNNLNISHDSKIVIPSNHENSATDERMLTNSITNDEHPYQNIKV